MKPTNIKSKGVPNRFVKLINVGINKFSKINKTTTDEHLLDAREQIDLLISDEDKRPNRRKTSSEQSL